MKNLISIDLGYGYTKVVAGSKRACFPSVIDLDQTNEQLDLGGQSLKHLVKIRTVKGAEAKSFLVGELAIKEGRSAQMTLGKNRFERNFAAILMLTGAFLAGVEGNAILAVGLPLTQYMNQRKEIEEKLIAKKIEAYVSVDGQPERHISFDEINIFAQGVGVIFANPFILPSEGLVAVVDVGYHTTDYLLVEITPTGPRPLSNFMGSIDRGVHTAHKLFIDYLQRETKEMVSLPDAREIWDGRETRIIGGKKIYLSAVKETCRDEAGQVIVAELENRLSEKIKYLEKFVLAGGGALEFSKTLVDQLPVARIIDDPQYANAVGFYRMLERKRSFVGNVRPLMK